MRPVLWPRRGRFSRAAGHLSAPTRRRPCRLVLLDDLRRGGGEAWARAVVVGYLLDFLPGLRGPRRGHEEDLVGVPEGASPRTFVHPSHELEEVGQVDRRHAGLLHELPDRGFSP